MARSSDEKKKLIETLAEAPFISHACKKLGIPRATFYRWRAEDENFGEGVRGALEMGRARGCDMAEAALLKLIQDGNIVAIKFFLQNNDPRYTPKRAIYVSPHHTLGPGETCPVCNSIGSLPLSEEDKDILHKLLDKNTYSEPRAKKRN